MHSRPCQSAPAAASKPTKLVATAKAAQPSTATPRNARITRRGPKRSSQVPSGNWVSAKAKEVAAGQQAEIPCLQRELRAEHRRERGGHRTDQRRQKVGQGKTPGTPRRRCVETVGRQLRAPQRRSWRRQLQATEEGLDRVPVEALSRRPPPETPGCRARNTRCGTAQPGPAGRVPWACTPCAWGAPATVTGQFSAGSSADATVTLNVCRLARRQAVIATGTCAACPTSAQASANFSPPDSQLCMCSSTGVPSIGTAREALSGLQGIMACSGVPSTGQARQLKVGLQAPRTSSAARPAARTECSNGVSGMRDSVVPPRRAQWPR